MSERKVSPFIRPLIAGAAFMLFFCGFLILKGRDTNPAKLALVGSWFLIGAVGMAVMQIMRKKEFGWVGNLGGVVAIGMAVAVIMLWTDD